MPHFGPHFQPSSRALNFTHNLGNLKPRLANEKGGHFGDAWIAQDFTQIRENRGQPITVWGTPLQTLISAKDAPFWASFPSLLQRPLILPSIWEILSRD